jgi:hypothetical protein
MQDLDTVLSALLLVAIIAFYAFGYHHQPI